MGGAPGLCPSAAKPHRVLATKGALKVPSARTVAAPNEFIAACGSMALHSDGVRVLGLKNQKPSARSRLLAPWLSHTSYRGLPGPGLCALRVLLFEGLCFEGLCSEGL